jgi:hypothetical protein
MTTLIHIRNCKDGTCLDAYGQWISQISGARTFPTATAAVEYCHAEKLKGVELLILRPNQPPVSVPVKGTRAR